MGYLLFLQAILLQELQALKGQEAGHHKKRELQKLEYLMPWRELMRKHFLARDVCFLLVF